VTLIKHTLWLISCGVLLCAPGHSYADNKLEYKLKAAYLINLGEFIVWQDPNKETQDSFSICVHPTDPVNAYLQGISQHLVKGKTLKIVNGLAIEQLQQCHIVYLNSIQFLKTPQLLQQLSEHSVLTISSASGFVKQGGGIEFFIKKNKVRMRINLGTIKQSGLAVSSKLLRLMEVLNP